MSDNRQLIAGCLATIQTVRMCASNTISIRHLEILFLIYLHEGITRHQLQDMMFDMSETSVRRYVDQLLKVEWTIANLGAKTELIREEEADNDGRVKEIYLTDSGKNVIEIIANQMLASLESLDVAKDSDLYTA